MRRLPALLNGKSHVIWDWNGTLLDDVDLCIELGSEVLELFGYERVTRESYLKYFRFPVVDYYKDLGVDLHRTPFDELTRHFMGRYQERVRHSPLFDGTCDMLDELAATGTTFSVLSATYEPDLHWQLEHHGLKPRFQHIYGLGDQHARSKIERGRQLLSQLNVPPSEVVLIGDTNHDAEVAAAIGVEALLLSGGHQSKERLQACGHQVFLRAPA